MVDIALGCRVSDRSVGWMERAAEIYIRESH